MRAVGLVAATVLLAGCGSSGHAATTAAADPVRAFEAEVQHFRPAMEGYVQRRYCTNLSAAQCKCAERMVDRDYVSASAFHSFVVGLIRRDPRATSEWNAVVGSC